MKKGIILIILQLLVFYAIAAPPPGVGQILNSSGRVKVDIFGTGEFIPGSPGEQLYSNSIIQTGEGRLLLLLDGEEMEIPGSVTILIEDLLSSREREKEISWFGTFVLGLKVQADKIASGGESVPLGTNNNPIAEHQPEMMDEALLLRKTLETVREKINREDFSGAVELLSSIPDGRDEVIMNQLKGYCYFRMGLYEMCILSLVPLAEKDPYVNAQIALSYWLLGMTEEARPYLEQSRELLKELEKSTLKSEQFLFLTRCFPQA